MNATRYHASAARTRPPRSYRDLLLMAALGIGGESGEVLATTTSDTANTRDHRIKELGDVCWYVALMADMLGMDAEALWVPTFDAVIVTWHGGAIRVSIEAGGVVEAVKKHLYHEKGIAPVQAALSRLTTAIYLAGLTIDADLPEVWAANIEKLDGRHPKGWSADYRSDL